MNLDDILLNKMGFLKCLSGIFLAGGRGGRGATETEGSENMSGLNPTAEDDLMGLKWLWNSAEKSLLSSSCGEEDDSFLCVVLPLCRIAPISPHPDFLGGVYSGFAMKMDVYVSLLEICRLKKKIPRLAKFSGEERFKWKEDDVHSH